MCWYFKINETLAVLKDVRDHLVILGSTMSSSLSLQQKQDVLRHERLGKAYLIDEIIPNGKAAAARLKVGDILIAYNGHQITSEEDISTAASSVIEPTTQLTVIRGVNCLTLTIKSGRMGINGHLKDLDAHAYAIRKAHLVGSSPPEIACPGCGVTITGEDPFCGNCGHKI